MEKVKMTAGQKPVVDIEGTAFYLDMPGGVFRQVDAPANTINMSEVINSDTGLTTFAFDTRTKNVYGEILRPGDIPEHVKLLILPPLNELVAKQQQVAQNERQNVVRSSATLKKRTRHNRRKSIH